MGNTRHHQDRFAAWTFAVSVVRVLLAWVICGGMLLIAALFGIVMSLEHLSNILVHPWSSAGNAIAARIIAFLLAAGAFWVLYYETRRFMAVVKPEAESTDERH